MTTYAILKCGLSCIYKKYNILNKTNMFYNEEVFIICAISLIEYNCCIILSFEMQIRWMHDESFGKEKLWK